MVVMFLPCRILTSATSLSSPVSSHSPRSSNLPKFPPNLYPPKFPVSPLKLQCRLNPEIDQEVRNPSPQTEFRTGQNELDNGGAMGGSGEDEDDDDDDDGEVSGVRVPKQKYIAVSKADLLDAIVLMFESQEEIDQFLLLSSCLDSILHAEHKKILEEMRVDYDSTQPNGNKRTGHEVLASSERISVSTSQVSSSDIDKSIGNGNMDEHVEDKTDLNKTMPSDSAPSSRSTLGSSNVERNSFEDSRVAVATRFQRSFVQLLYNAQFEELSATDLMLTSALNTDYLLTLPIYVDWKRASDSKAIIFRRGYATEKQKGLLIVEKLDYLQSKVLQGIFFRLSKPLGRVGNWLTETFKSTIQGKDTEVWAKRIELWLQETTLFQPSYSRDENMSDDLLDVDHLSDKDLPIWLAAQRAVTRYEGILSSAGPRGRLLSKLLNWAGLVPSTPNKPFDVDSGSTASEPYLRPIFLSRISLGDIWKPASRKYCGNDLWKMLKNAISILLSRSILQEPAFQELILLYTEETDEEETNDEADVPTLQLKIYKSIPIPDLPVIFPHKKLSFRIIDTVRLDGATILGLSAYLINYKFENILSSPSAVLLDVIAISALIIYVTRVALGYKQTWDRYQLLVNKTLYEKTVASGFGSVHFLLDASVQQQYKEAILAYAILLKEGNDQVTCTKSVGDKCEKFVYSKFKEKVEMPVHKAMDTLVRLGLVTKKAADGKIGLQPIPCPKAYEILKQRWNSFHP